MIRDGKSVIPGCQTVNIFCSRAIGPYIRIQSGWLYQYIYSAVRDTTGVIRSYYRCDRKVGGRIYNLICPACHASIGIGDGYAVSASGELLKILRGLPIGPNIGVRTWRIYGQVDRAIRKTAGLIG